MGPAAHKIQTKYLAQPALRPHMHMRSMFNYLGGTVTTNVLIFSTCSWSTPPKSLFCPLLLSYKYVKENIWTMKELGEYNERKCHLFCDLNFYEFWEKLVLPPTPPPTPNSLQLIYTPKQLTYISGAHESLKSKLGDIFCNLLFPSLSMYSYWSTQSFKFTAIYSRITGYPYLGFDHIGEFCHAAS
jgi:hypothetical protein